MEISGWGYAESTLGADKYNNYSKHIQYSQYLQYILYDFSGHKPDLEGEIQICFRYGFSRPASVYKQWDHKSARPDLHVSTQKAGIRKPVLSLHWESRFFQTCHLSKMHGGQV